MNAIRLATKALGVTLALSWAGASPGTPEGASLIKVGWGASRRPANAAEMADMFTTARVKAIYEDGSAREHALSYRMLFGTQTRVRNNLAPAGALYDEHMRPIADPSRPQRFLTDQTPDGSALLQLGGKLFHLSQYEYSWLLADGRSSGKAIGRITPSSVVLSELRQAPDGTLSVISQRAVDLSAAGGLTVACNATVSPWNTFVSSSENYSADGRAIEADRAAGRPDILSAMTRLYFRGRRRASPYEQGVVPEIMVGSNGSTRVVKHYALGRGTYEMVQIMPDRRTVYGPHDGTNKPFTMFVADRPADLSSGTLYAARFHQRAATRGGRFELQWVRLGHATDAELRHKVRAGITFSSIFEASEGPAPGFTEVRVAAAKHPEYLRVRDRQAAAFLETLRYAALAGATSELRKAEGLAYDPAGKRLFLAISDIDKGMRAGRTSGAAGDHIRVGKVDAGGVYALPVASGQRDTGGAPIASSMVAVSMSVPLGLLGRDLPEPDELGNTADLDHVANPDNLYWSAAYRTLFVGEDSVMHRNNVLWAWQDGMKLPVPLLFAPMGAELTGLRVHPDVGGHAYALANAQHVGDFEPGDHRLLSRVRELIAQEWMGRQEAPIGYLAGMPALRSIAR